MKDRFEINNVRVTKTSEMGLTLDSVGFDKKDFLEREVLEKTASLLLENEVYKDFIIYYDGCCKYNISK